jgi:hypothetical protein
MSVKSMFTLICIDLLLCFVFCDQAIRDRANKLKSGAGQPLNLPKF